MAQLSLQPVAVRMTWFSEQPLVTDKWCGALRHFLSDLGQNCMSAGGLLIGHIKGVGMVEGSPCLQLNLVSLQQPVLVEGSVPDDTSTLGLVLNVLVFGLSGGELTVALGASRERALKSWSGSIDIEVLPAVAEYPLPVHDLSTRPKTPIAI